MNYHWPVIFLAFTMDTFTTGIDLQSCQISNTYQEDYSFDCATIPNAESHVDYLEQHSDKFVCKGSQHRYSDLESGGVIAHDATAFRVRSCSITNITDKFLQRISFVELVYLDFADIEAIENVSTGSITADNLKMVVLSMTHNNLTKLPTSLFEHAAELEEIYFAYNQIESLTFRGTGQRFTIVDLSHNRIQNLDTDAFVNLSNLVELRLSYNFIKYFPASLSNVKPNRQNYLYLDNNLIEKVDCNTFAKQYGVLLSGNPIKSIDLNCTENDLAKLFIGNSKFRWDEDDVMVELNLPASPLVDNLSEIHAAGNNIKRVSIERKMKNLRVLSLYNNSLTNISDILEHCSNLDELNLSDNDIGELSGNAFVEMRHLKQLFLRKTNLTKVEPQTTLSHLENLTVIDLSDNLLETFDFASIYYENLTHFYLRNNSLSELSNWSAVNFPSLIWFDISNNNFTCSYLRKLMNQIPERIELQPDSDYHSSTNTQNINGINCFCVGINECD